ncbi:hypothetical protein SUGI_0639110 [Cryptomeria japonica]|nr:hypothetical protein SUGI_0639110 [Cryptomeria japonica]
MVDARTICGLLFLLLAFYLALDPLHYSPIYDFPDFRTYSIEQPGTWKELQFGWDKQNRLQGAEIKFLNQLAGPECLAFDPQGRGPYTGTGDGRIMRWDGPENGWAEFAYTSPNRSLEICEPKVPAVANIQYEYICGRPLGLRFNKRTGYLYIADAYFGLLYVGPEGGLATPLTSEAEGVPLRFANDLDIDDDDNIYFTDSSHKYQRRHFLQIIFSTERSGRVLKFDAKTKQTKVLVQGLHFPNGLSLSKDKSFFVYAADSGRLSRYWLKGPKAGTTDTFAILPGFADNVRINEKGEFWVALHCRRNALTYFLGARPGLRMLLLRLPISAEQQYMGMVGGKVHGIIAKYSSDGELLDVLEDTEGKVVKAVSHVEEKDGRLWIGSVLMPYIATLDNY